MHIEETRRLIEELQNTMDIDRFMNRHDYSRLSMSFTDYLEQMIMEYGVKKSDIVRNSNIARSYAYEVFSGFKKPSRDKVLMLGFTIGMTFEETQKLIILAGFNELHPKNRRDAIIIHSILKKLSYVDCNLLLDELCERLLD